MTKRKRVFVTGAGGFIGANLVRTLLARGDEVHVLKRPERIQWRLGQIKNKLKQKLMMLLQSINSNKHPLRNNKKIRAQILIIK